MAGDPGNLEVEVTDPVQSTGKAGGRERTRTSTS